jgi:hypothetical protein
MERGFMTAGMPHGRRLALGALTLWPVVWLFLITLPFMVWAVSRPDNSHDETIITGFLLLGVGHVLTAVLVLLLTAAYCVHVFRNPRLDREKRWLWFALVLTANVLAMPPYWWFHIWREPEVAPPAPAAAPG